MYHVAVGDVKEHLSYDVFRTPWGWVGAASTPRGLRRLVLPRPDRAEAARELGLPPGVPTVPWPELRGAIRDYFAGKGSSPDLPVDLSGIGGFTRRALEAAGAIPRGATLTYGELARRAGSPRAARAAGRVMARNPIPLVIPCHRVVAAAGPGGYAGGAALKARLLALEARS